MSTPTREQKSSQKEKDNVKRKVLPMRSEAVNDESDKEKRYKDEKVGDDRRPENRLWDEIQGLK